MYDYDLVEHIHRLLEKNTFFSEVKVRVSTSGTQLGRTVVIESRVPVTVLVLYGALFPLL